MNENVVKFFELYYSDPALRKRVADAEAAYPGSLEIRSAVVTEILLPIADELGLPFTLMDLRVYETVQKARGCEDRELTEEELESPDDDRVFFLIDHGWSYDTELFKERENGEPAQ